MANVMKPNQKDAVSVRHIPSTELDRKENVEKFKEHKAEQEKIKDERFAAIEEKRKNRPPRDGKGTGINIEVTSDK